MDFVTMLANNGAGAAQGGQSGTANRHIYFRLCGGGLMHIEKADRHIYLR